jgi:FkbM family methyltransferase
MNLIKPSNIINKNKKLLHPSKEYYGEFINNIHVDNILRSYFPNFEYKGVFLDVGAFDPIQISNSHHFYLNNWDVYAFEANTNLIPKLKKFRKNVYNYAIYDIDKPEVIFNIVESNGWTAGFSSIELNKDYEKIFPCNNKKITQIKVPQKTLNTILDTEIKINSIDILSIDVEGGELNVLKGLSLVKYQPKVILVKNVTHDKNIRTYLQNFGYKIDIINNYNEFYIK